MSRAGRRGRAAGEGRMGVEHERTEVRWGPRGGTGTGAAWEGGTIHAPYRHPELRLAGTFLSPHGPGAAAALEGARGDLLPGRRPRAADPGGGPGVPTGRPGGLPPRLDPRAGR